VIDPEFEHVAVATPSFIEQILTLLRERLAEIKTILPPDVQAAISKHGGYLPQGGAARFLVNEFTIECDVPQEVSHD
jgi:hypothetical protein